jgi:O-acetyl-ADP-ribose deacetylase (regulator of RNase III)
MLNLKYEKGNVFDRLHPGVILVHSCNAKNTWGSGIALEIKHRYPKAFKEHCEFPNQLGDGYIIPVYDIMIGCLIVSEGYGKRVSHSDEIQMYTYWAIRDLLEDYSCKTIEIYSPKINSGRFFVPWHYTETVIRKACAHFPEKEINWTVFEL